MNFIKLYKIPLLFAILSIVFYLNFGYGLERSDFVKLISLYASLFFVAYLFIEKFKLNFWFLGVLGIVFRLVFSVAIPNLSEDFYRFLWDGQLLSQGISPYIFTPNDIFNTGIPFERFKVFLYNVDVFTEAFVGMSELSLNNFSNYPPINQLFFSFATFVGGNSVLGSVIVLRMLIILADLGILYFGKKILEKLNLPIRNIFWYFLNPFIIIELTGNLHFEGVMLFFFIWALYLLFNGKWFWAAILIGISISVKLIPLLFLPLFLKYFISKEVSTEPVLRGVQRLNRTTLLKFYFIIGITVFITFLPFLSSEFIQNFSATITLWFQNFEFNASVYYLIRWFGFQVVGWNIIETVGKILPVLVFLFVLGIAFFRKNKNPQQLLTAMLLVILFYFLLSTTVHPWYIATPLLLSVFTKYKFPIIWSFVVMLSYSAYEKDGFDEKLWLVALEYIVVVGFAVCELYPFRLQKRLSRF